MQKSNSSILRLVEIFLRASGLYSSSEIFSIMNDLSIADATLERDLLTLRTMGIDIHSSKKHLQIISETKNDVLVSLFSELYNSINCHDFSFFKLISSVKQPLKFLSNLLDITKSLNSNSYLKILYSTNSGNHTFEILPMALLSYNDDIRLIALNNEILKQYSFKKIQSAEILNIFELDKTEHIAELKKILNVSFGKWIGHTTDTVQIELFDELAGLFKDVDLLTDQKIISESADSIIIEGKMNSYSELASWIISSRGKAKAISPQKLINMVKSIAKQALDIHK